jgi:hypothetical protein
VVDQEERYEEGVNYVAMQAESFLFGRVAFMAVGRAESRAFHAAILTAQLLPHGAEGFITFQLDLVA